MLTVEWVGYVFLHVDRYIAVELLDQGKYVCSIQLILLNLNYHNTYNHNNCKQCSTAFKSL